MDFGNKHLVHPSIAHFLELVGQGMSVSGAAKFAGVQMSVIDAYRANYPEFEKRVRQGIAEGRDFLRDNALARAVQGRPAVYDEQGNCVRKEIMPSDSLLMFLLEGRDKRVAIEDKGSTPLHGEPKEEPAAAAEPVNVPIADDPDVIDITERLKRFGSKG